MYITFKVVRSQNYNEWMGWLKYELFFLNNYFLPRELVVIFCSGQSMLSKDPINLDKFNKNFSFWSKTSLGSLDLGSKLEMYGQNVSKSVIKLRRRYELVDIEKDQLCYEKCDQVEKEIWVSEGKES